MGMFAGKTMAAGGSFPWRVLLPQKLAKVFMKNEFYTYAWLRADGTPYYIGKGRDRRAYSCSGKPCKMPLDKNRILILKRNLTEEEAFKHEIYMIAVFGRKDNGTGTLRNKSDGGQGKTGYIHTEETKNKISEKVRGENHPLYGTSPSLETREKMSIKLKGRVLKKETRERMSASRVGKSHTKENREKMRLRKWWNNGVSEKWCADCPEEGWVRGRIKRKKGGK